MKNQFPEDKVARVRVLQIARRFVRQEWGGTETVVLETSRRLLAGGMQTEVICPNALAKEDRETMGGVMIRRFGYFYPYFGLSANARNQMDKKAGNLFSFSLMRYLKRQPAVDLVHLHTAKRLGGIGRYVARKRKIPYVVSLHGGCLDVPAEESQQWTAPTRGALEWGKALGWWVGSRRVLEDASAIICVGEGEYSAIRKEYPNHRVVHLPNGVDIDRFRNGDGNAFREKFSIDSDVTLLLCMARIDPQKNQLELIRSMPAWKRTRGSVHLLLVGPVTSSEYATQLRKEIDRLELADDVTIVRGIDPQSQDLPNAYHAADLFVLPSMHEPFGIVVVEAWAAGLPVVASNAGGLSGLITDQVTGRLFDPSREGDCAGAVLDALNAPSETTHKMIQAARREAEDKYSWEQVTEQLKSIYETVLNDATS